MTLQLLVVFAALTLMIAISTYYIVSSVRAESEYIIKAIEDLWNKQ